MQETMQGTYPWRCIAELWYFCFQIRIRVCTGEFYLIKCFFFFVPITFSILYNWNVFYAQSVIKHSMVSSPGLNIILLFRTLFTFYLLSCGIKPMLLVTTTENISEAFFNPNDSLGQPNAPLLVTDERTSTVSVQTHGPFL